MARLRSPEWLQLRAALPATAFADEAAAFEKGQILLFCLNPAVLVFLREKPTGGCYFRRVFRFWRSRLSERGHGTKQNKCSKNRWRDWHTKHGW